MAGPPAGGRRGVLIAAAIISAGLTVAAVVVVLLGRPWHDHVGTITVHVTATDPGHGRGLAVEPALHAFRQDPEPGSEIIRIDASHPEQTIEGFGAAMTDTSAWLLYGAHNISAATRTRVMRELFGPSGIHLSSVLIPIGASDFTHNGVPYSYQNHRDDKFSVAHDDSYILPALNRALEFDEDLSFIGVPWSVPAWMKANDKLSNEGNTGTIRPADYGAYAAYLAKFLRQYAENGVSVGELIPANEPTNPTAYPGMNIPAPTENTLISRYLAPELNHFGLATEVYGSDLGWGNAAYAKAIATGSDSGDLSGIAWHCYYGSPTAMSAVQRLDPKLGVQMTECSPGISTVSESEVVIESLRNHASVVDLWNIALDDRGGPVQPPNHGCPGCFGLLRVDTENHTVHATSAYDDLGQASKYIQPGARVLASNSFVHYRYTGPGKDYVSANVDDVAVRDRDGETVLMVYNNAPRARRISVVAADGYEFADTVPAGATVTFRWGRPV